jgi:hypothetical protein
LHVLAAVAAVLLALVLAAYAVTRPEADPRSWAHALPIAAIAAVPLVALPRAGHRGWRALLLAWPIAWWPVTYVMTVDVVQLDRTRYVDAWLRAADTWLLSFGNVVPLAWPLSGPVEEVANAFYFSYYVGVPLLLVWLAWRLGPEAASRYGLAVVLTVAACAALWVLVPSGGYHAGGAPSSSPWGPSTWTVHEMYALKPHFAAAFPSSHVAVSVAAAAVAIRFGATRLLWGWAFGIAFATVYGQYHFLVDVPSGWFVGAVIAAFALRTPGLVVPDKVRERVEEARRLLQPR